MEIKLHNISFNVSWTQIKRVFDSDLAEMLVTTWAIEFLRLRRHGQFHFTHMILISLLMVIVRALIHEAGRRSDNGPHREIVLRSRRSQMESLGDRRSATGYDRWFKHRGRKRRPGEYPY